jgi:hypothetical protein
MEQEISTHDVIEGPHVIDPNNLNVDPPSDEEPRNLLKMVVLFVGVPLFIATTLYFLWQNFRKLNEPSIPIVDNPKQEPIPSPSTPVVIDKTADFQTVENKILNFEIRIPKTWTIPEKALDETPLVRYLAPDNSQFEVFVADTTLNTLDEYLAKIDAENKTGWEGSASKEVLDTKPTRFGDNQAVIRKERWLAADFTTVVTYMKIDSKVYTFTVIPTPEEIYENQEAAKNYELILSTFKTVPSVEVEN